MKLLLSLLFLAFWIPAQAAEYEPRVFEPPEMQKLPYRLLKPAEHEGKLPLVIFLHGSGERGDDNEAQLKHGAPAFLKAQEKFPCYVIAPQCPKDQKWTDVDWSKPFTVLPAEMSPAAKSLMRLLEILPREFPDIDLDRIYLTGLSMGGFGTWDLLERFPESFAAGVPVCGGGDPAHAKDIAKLPIWTFHGGKDKAVDIEQTRRMVAALEKAGGHPLYSEYPTVGHNSWDNAYQEPELLPWLFAQRRGEPPVPFEKAASPFAQPPSNQFPGAGPVQDGLWFRPLWQTRRQQWAKDVEADQGAIVFLGDSITQGWESLAQDFAGRKVANRGISGDTTRGVLGRLKGDVLDVHPKAVSMLIGTNDIGLGAEPEVAAENVKAIVAALHKANPKLPVIINKVMPSTPEKGRPAEKLQKLNELVQQAVGKDPAVTFVDTFTLFANPKGEAKPEEFPDLLHPNASGYAKWKAALELVFARLKL
jgi:lysophospholipase L1-like esterase/poly(3-hydroxybutyrate) depolymerase